MSELILEVDCPAVTTEFGADAADSAPISAQLDL
jgi:hypothetical protein